MTTLASVLGVAAGMIVLLGAVVGCAAWFYARGKNEGLVEQSTIKRVPQLEDLVAAQSERISRIHSDYRDLRERVSVLDERKASKDNIPALRVPTGDWTREALEAEEAKRRR